MPKRGSILILMLFVLAVLSLMALSFAYRAALETRSSHDRAVAATLKVQAASAAAIALVRLNANSNAFDHPGESWHAHDPLAMENWLDDWSPSAPQGEPEFAADYQVVDEEGKLNVAYASSAALEKLGMAPAQIASLFDWMDADAHAQAEGAEDAYYLSLPRPHRCKNAPLETLDELLLIRGFHLTDYWGEDANHNGVLDAAENDGAESYPPDNADGQLQPGWVHLLTCVGGGRINLNTAPYPVLRALPLSEGAAEQILRFVSGGLSGGDVEAHAFRSEKDIEQLQGLRDADRAVLTGIAAYKSEHFRIFAQAQHKPTGLRCHLELLVRATDRGHEILQWKAGH